MEAPIRKTKAQQIATALNSRNKATYPFWQVEGDSIKFTHPSFSNPHIATNFYSIFKEIINDPTRKDTADVLNNTELSNNTITMNNASKYYMLMMTRLADIQFLCAIAQLAKETKGEWKQPWHWNRSKNILTCKFKSSPDSDPKTTRVFVQKIENALGVSITCKAEEEHSTLSISEARKHINVFLEKPTLFSLKVSQAYSPISIASWLGKKLAPAPNKWTINQNNLHYNKEFSTEDAAKAFVQKLKEKLPPSFDKHSVDSAITVRSDTPNVFKVVIKGPPLTISKPQSSKEAPFSRRVPKGDTAARLSHSDLEKNGYKLTTQLMEKKIKEETERYL